jgi:hypothetical protein
MPTPPRRMSTRPGNTSKHPGLPVASTTRRTSAEVKAAARAKEAAKKERKDAEIARIKRVTEFESKAKDNEDITDATPRPNFAPHGSSRVTRGTASHTELEPNSDGHIAGA